jgi:type I site-specific restriction-modification system R (restriction) subunit
MSEQTAVQNPMIQYAGQFGWQPVSRLPAIQWRGLIWHTQGSGKTLTMITIAAGLLRDVRSNRFSGNETAEAVTTSEKPTILMLVDRDTLDREFLALRGTEGVSAIEEIDAVLNRVVALKEMMKAEHRVANIAQFVAQDFRERIEPMGFKAFLVAVDREACALY